MPQGGAAPLRSAGLSKVRERRPGRPALTQGRSRGRGSWALRRPAGEAAPSFATGVSRIQVDFPACLGPTTNSARPGSSFISRLRCTKGDGSDDESKGRLRGGLIQPRVVGAKSRQQSPIHLTRLAECNEPGQLPSADANIHADCLLKVQRTRLIAFQANPPQRNGGVTEVTPPKKGSGPSPPPGGRWGLKTTKRAWISTR